MVIYITDKDATRNVELRYWDNKHPENGWSYDVLPYLDPNISVDHPTNGNVEANASAADAAMTDAQYQKIVDFWRSEIDGYNAHSTNNFLVEGMDEDELEAEYAKELEYSFDAE